MLDLKKRQYRRIRKAISQINTQTKQNEQAEVLNLLDMRINHCKQLASCILEYKRLLRQDCGCQEKVRRMFEIEEKCCAFMNQQGPISCTFNYIKLFFFRLIKQMKYFSESISVIEHISKEMNEIMVNQCSNNTFSVQEIFNHCQKKLILEGKKIRKAIESSISEAQHQQLPMTNKSSNQLSQKKSDSKTQMMMLLIEKIYKKEKENKNNQSEQKKNGEAKAFKKDPDFFQAANQALRTIYKILPLDKVQVTQHYLPNLEYSVNIQLIARRQLKRNNKPRKQIIQYSKNFDDFRLQKIRRTHNSGRLRKTRTHLSQYNDSSNTDAKDFSTIVDSSLRKQRLLSIKANLNENNLRIKKNISQFRINKNSPFKNQINSKVIKSKSSFVKNQQMKKQIQNLTLKQPNRIQNSSKLISNKKDKKLRILPR